MKLHGNTSSNKHYNPKNKKPDIPLDADEVDSAMERFIRKKYQEKSLVDGRPEPPSRPEVSPSTAQSATQMNQPPLGAELPAPGKKHKFFGFSLRTSSKKDRPGVNEAFKITPVEYSPTSGVAREVPEHELQEKLAQLRDMGFTDGERNLDVLKRFGGDLERTIATLVRLGPSAPSRRQTRSPAARVETTAASASAPPTASISNNPFDQIREEEAQKASFGLSFDVPPPKQPLSAQPSGNPWQSAISSQQSSGLEQQFAGMQVSNPLFPHNTGGYGTQTAYQQDPRLQNLTPPVSQVPQQYGYAASPTTTSNPFHQMPVSSQSTGNNPFIQYQQSQPGFAPQGNPFMTMQQAQVQSQSGNPFGLPPSQSPPQAQQYMSSPQAQSANPFDYTQIQISPSSQQTQQMQGFPSMTQQTQSSQFGQSQQSQPQIPNYNYGQPQQPQGQQQFSQIQQPQYPQQSQPQQQYSYQNQPFQQQQQQPQQPQPLAPQQTGRYTKTDIMALFNQPIQQQPQLASINEDPQTQQQQQYQSQNQAYQQQTQQPISPAPTNNPYGALNPTSAKRSATLPVNMHSSPANSLAANSRNPFLNSAATSRSPSGTSVSSTPLQPTGQWPGQLQVQQPASWNQGARHASNESVSVNNPSLMDGRHSPDAFAGLSARY